MNSPEHLETGGGPTIVRQDLGPGKTTRSSAGRRNRLVIDPLLSMKFHIDNSPTTFNGRAQSGPNMTTFTYINPIVTS